MSRKKVLVIDDEQDLCFLVKTILEGAGDYTVTTADTVDKGRQAAQSGQPDLILLDFVMPDVHGSEMIDFFKKSEATKRIPIVLMSGLGEMVYNSKKKKWQWHPNRSPAQDKEDFPEPLKWEKNPERIADGLGVADFLSKPFSREALLDVTKNVLEISNQDNAEEEGDAF